jgi:hypothetical protein
MQIGSPSYKKCPHCSVENEYYSGPYNVCYYGLTEWSDGETFEELPSLKKTKLQKCESCGKFYWFSQMGGGMSAEDYSEALDYFVELYSKKNLLNLILSSRNKRRIFYIRLNILRSYNDRIRIHPLSKKGDEKKTMSEEDKIVFINNAIELIELLKMLEPENHFLIAELYRNIGSFEEATIELNKVSDVNYKRILLTEIVNKNCDVIIIKQPLIE